MKSSFHITNEWDTILEREISSKLHRSSALNTMGYFLEKKNSSRNSQGYDDIHRVLSSHLAMERHISRGIRISRKYLHATIMAQRIQNSLKKKKNK